MEKLLLHSHVHSNIVVFNSGKPYVTFFSWNQPVLDNSAYLNVFSLLWNCSKQSLVTYFVSWHLRNCCWCWLLGSYPSIMASNEKSGQLFFQKPEQKVTMNFSRRLVLYIQLYHTYVLLENYLTKLYILWYSLYIIKMIKIK